MKSLRMTDEMAKMLKIDAAEPFKEPPRRKSLTFADVKRNETLKAKPATEMTIEKAQVDKGAWYLVYLPCQKIMPHSRCFFLFEKSW